MCNIFSNEYKNLTISHGDFLSKGEFMSNLIVKSKAMANIINEYFLNKVVTYNKRLDIMLTTAETRIDFFPLFKDERKIVFVVEYQNFVKNIDAFKNRYGKVNTFSVVNNLVVVFTNDKDFVDVDFKQTQYVPSVVTTEYTPDFVGLLGDVVIYKNETLKVETLTVLYTEVHKYAENDRLKTTTYYVQNYDDYRSMVSQLVKVRKTKDERTDMMVITAYELDGYIINLYEKL